MYEFPDGWMALRKNPFCGGRYATHWNLTVGSCEGRRTRVLFGEKLLEQE